jgi:O-antigen/teichoic acid export membrane protein
MNAWNRKEIIEANNLITKYLQIFALFAFPIIFGLIALREEGIQLLAGAKYSNISYLIPILIFGIAINGIDIISNSGFLFREKTVFVMLSTFAAAIINLLLNIILLPIMGLTGAAIATLLSYLIYACVGFTYSIYVLKFQIPFRSIFKYFCFSFLMYIFLVYIPFQIQNLLLLVSSKVVMGSVIYLCLILIFDRKFISQFIYRKSYS